MKKRKTSFAGVSVVPRHYQVVDRRIRKGTATVKKKKTITHESRLPGCFEEYRCGTESRSETSFADLGCDGRCVDVRNSVSGS